MDVYMDEIDTVLSYLKMELGYYFYEQVYTKQEELDIEARRVKRESTKIKPIKQAPAILMPIPSAAIVQANPPAPETKPKLSKRLDKWITRFDKNEETYINCFIFLLVLFLINKFTHFFPSNDFRKCAEWDLYFRSYFDKFTEKQPSDRWVMTMEKVIKNHPLIREKKWTRFLGEMTIAGFKCEV